MPTGYGDNINSVIRRFSGYVDTSGAEPPRGVQMAPRIAGGVYTTYDNANEMSSEDPFTGRISLGILAAMVVGAMLFYLWTNGIQGGG